MFVTIGAKSAVQNADRPEEKDVATDDKLEKKDADKDSISENCCIVF